MPSRKQRGSFPPYPTVSNQLRGVDFFCGAGGMSYGLAHSGIQILGGVDIDGECEQTYEANHSGAKFLRADISELKVEEFAEKLGVERHDSQLVFAGCSPCQYWSKVRTDRSKSTHTAFLLRHFERFIDHFRPGFVVVENVPGLLRRKGQSLLPEFIVFLERLGYSYADGVINASQYGVPQSRQRYLMIACNFRTIESLPSQDEGDLPTVRRFIGNSSGLKPLAAGERDEKDDLHRAAILEPHNLQRLASTRHDGGDRSAWRDSDLQLEAYRGKDNSFRDVYGRMFWDRPAPTITTRFNSLSNGRFGHPEQDRAISLREGALLQTFPRKFRFHGRNQSVIARMIGNAVPPILAKRIGQHIVKIAANG